MEKCVFCNLNEERTRIISETNYNFSILSNPALMEGHCLVIPKRHVERISELDEDETIDLMKELVKIEELLLTKYSGCDIRQNYRPFQQQDNLKINHLHFHLQPRSLYDELYQKSQRHKIEVFRMLNISELDKIKSFLLDGK